MIEARPFIKVDTQISENSETTSELTHPLGEVFFKARIKGDTQHQPLTERQKLDIIRNLGRQDIPIDIRIKTVARILFEIPSYLNVADDTIELITTAANRIIRAYKDGSIELTKSNDDAQPNEQINLKNKYINSDESETLTGLRLLACIISHSVNVIKPDANPLHLPNRVSDIPQAFFAEIYDDYHAIYTNSETFKTEVAEVFKLIRDSKFGISPSLDDTVSILPIQEANIEIKAPANFELEDPSSLVKVVTDNAQSDELDNPETEEAIPETGLKKDYGLTKAIEELDNFVVSEARVQTTSDQVLEDLQQRGLIPADISNEHREEYSAYFKYVTLIEALKTSQLNQSLHIDIPSELASTVETRIRGINSIARSIVNNLFFDLKKNSFTANVEINTQLLELVTKATEIGSRETIYNLYRKSQLYQTALCLVKVYLEKIVTNKTQFNQFNLKYILNKALYSESKFFSKMLNLDDKEFNGNLLEQRVCMLIRQSVFNLNNSKNQANIIDEIEDCFLDDLKNYAQEIENRQQYSDLEDLKLLVNKLVINK